MKSRVEEKDDKNIWGEKEKDDKGLIKKKTNKKDSNWQGEGETQKTNRRKDEEEKDWEKTGWKEERKKGKETEDEEDNRKI